MRQRPKSFRRHVNPQTKIFSRALRKRQTPAEVILWEELRAQKLGARFRRQSIIFGWIVDFYCPVAGLVIEVDGSSHDKPDKIESDRVRDNKMESNGFIVFRFKNHEIKNDLKSVLDKINKFLEDGE